VRALTADARKEAMSAFAVAGKDWPEFGDPEAYVRGLPGAAPSAASPRTTVLIDPDVLT